MEYQTKNYENLLGTQGFSEKLLKTHFNLYNGYVNNVNKTAEILKEMLDQGKTSTIEYAELKRRFGWEFAGMRLHELYFENMTKEKKELNNNSEFYNKLIEQFGSYQNWERDFQSTGKMRGIGWTILYYDKKGKRLFNTWINEHDIGHLSGCEPLLVMDVFEHAYLFDYGVKRGDYINAFFNAVNWEEVNKRFEKTS